jgi:hypothetical protein
MLGTLLVLGLAVSVILILFAIFIGLGNLFPASVIAATILAANSYIAVFYSVLPYTTTAILSILGAIFSIEVLVILPYKMAKWVYKKIPGIS